MAVIFADILTDMITFSAYISIGLTLRPGAVFLWPVGFVAGIVTVAALVGGYRLARNGEKWQGPPPMSGLRGWIGRNLYHFAQGLAPLRDTRRFLLIVLTAQAIWFFEFDIAHAPEEVSEHYPSANQDLLRECRILMLAMIATWRWDRDDQLPNGRQLGTEWLSQMRVALGRYGLDAAP